jgi:hypothetical protein
MPLQVAGGDELDILDLSFESDQPDEGTEDPPPIRNEG